MKGRFLFICFLLSMVSMTQGQRWELYSSNNSDLQSDSIATIVLDTTHVYFGSQVGLSIRSVDSWSFLDTISTIDGDVLLHDISAMALTPHGWNYVGTTERGVARLHYDVDGVSGASSFSTDWSVFFLPIVPRYRKRCGKHENRCPRL